MSIANVEGIRSDLRYPAFPNFWIKKIHLFIASIRVYNNSPEVWVLDFAI